MNSNNQGGSRGRSKSKDLLYCLHRGNLAYGRKDYDEARSLYLDAIKVSPNMNENGNKKSDEKKNINKSLSVIYSNLSATCTHLKLYSESLEYANLSITYWPQFAKAYSRKGCALTALGQKAESLKAYKNGLKLHPSHQGLLAGLECAQTISPPQIGIKRHLTSMANNNNNKNHTNNKRAKIESNNNDNSNNLKGDPVNVVEDFVSEVLESEFTKNESKITVSHSNIGTAKEELERLLQKNYAWINLNPFVILQLPITATSEDVKQRYRILSSLVHPDKCKDERARLAFEEVHRGYDQLRDEKTKKNVIALIKMIKARVEKEWKINKNNNNMKSPHKTLEEAIKYETLKSFAENEQERREAIDTRQSNRVREGNLKLQAKEEKQKKKKLDREWKKGIADRVDRWNEFLSSTTNNKNSKSTK